MWRRSTMKRAGCPKQTARDFTGEQKRSRTTTINPGTNMKTKLIATAIGRPLGR
jgi:hypothetical protein